MSLREKIKNREKGILLYGLTPPKLKTSEEKVLEIARKQFDSVEEIGVDGLVLYDIHDEKDRIEEERPFPFLETIDPVVYSQEYLKELSVPRIVYRCVGKYSKEKLTNWIKNEERGDSHTVFVGAASKGQDVKMKLRDAYEIYGQTDSNLALGGVCIPERHITKNDEHLRVISKQEAGCEYFITQAVYNVEASKNFLSDYYYHCKSENIEMVPIIFTISPCGSKKTLEFMKWLGINVSKWLENEILRAENTLDRSVEVLLDAFRELLEFANKKNIPIGCNIESISIRKTEIAASIYMAKEIKKMLNE